MKPLPEAELNVYGVHFRWLDISKVITLFYQRVAVDQLLRIPFASVEDWPHHIERLTHFWWIRFGGPPYLDVRYDPIGKHFESGFNHHFLERWLELFDRILRETLNPQQAKLWQEFATSMGASLERNNELMIARYKKSI